MAKRKIVMRKPEEKDEMIRMYHEYIKKNELSTESRRARAKAFCEMLEEEYGEHLSDGTLCGWLSKETKKTKKRKAGLIGAKTRALGEDIKIKVGSDFDKYYTRHQPMAESTAARNFIEGPLKEKGLHISNVTVMSWRRKYINSISGVEGSQELIGPKPTHVVSVKGQQATFCEDCAFHNVCDNEDEDTCRAAIGLRATGKFSYVRKPASPPPVEHTRCSKINKIGNCMMFLSKRETR